MLQLKICTQCLINILEVHLGEEPIFSINLSNIVSVNQARANEITSAFSLVSNFSGLLLSLIRYQPHSCQRRPQIRHHKP